MIGTSSPPAAFGLLPKAGVGFSRGALRCVITSTTPGAASAAEVSISAMQPQAIVEYFRAA